MAERLRMLERCERVRDLDRLRDNHDQCIGIGHARTIAILTGNLGLRWNSSHAFDPQPRDQA